MRADRLFLACKFKYCETSSFNAKQLEERLAIHIGAGLYKCPHCDYLDERNVSFENPQTKTLQNILV